MCAVRGYDGLRIREARVASAPDRFEPDSGAFFAARSNAAVARPETQQRQSPPDRIASDSQTSVIKPVREKAPALSGQFLGKRSDQGRSTRYTLSAIDEGGKQANKAAGRNTRIKLSLQPHSRLSLDCGWSARSRPALRRGIIMFAGIQMRRGSKFPAGIVFSCQWSGRTRI